MMMRFWFVFIFMFLPAICWGQIIVKKTGGGAAFPLVSSHETVIYYDARDYGVVEKTACLLAEDIKRVTDKKVSVSSKKVSSEYAVVVGTVGHNAFVDRLVAKGLLDVSAIRGGWEQFVVKTIDAPVKGVKKVLVIAGCDRRGTAYGVFTLSEAIGVSPLYWWADVPTKRKSQLYVEHINYVSQAPSVQYRGIFINDEGWGITPWAGRTFDKELGDIGPKTYAKVCELILRMKGNMLAPAMHPSSGAFNKYPENKLVADSYGIIMSTSHCEPLLFNNVTEWDKKIMGEWNYMTNKEGINKMLDQRVLENAPYENIYTIAMRGIHDAGLVGVPKDKEVNLVQEVIADQRGILKKHIDSPIDSIPQIFVPYKEVLDIYERGLRLPEDIMLVWPDDNFGYIKRLNNKEERSRRGEAGVYYHISYLGEPHDYLWLNTTPPALMFEEMRKAYDTGAKRYWLLNVGDIKPGVTELTIAAKLDYYMRELGAEGNSFDTIVASGLHSAMPHAVPTAKKLEKGDFITMDFGCRYDGYCSDMTRTVVLGEASSKQKEIYGIVLKAQMAALEQICAGKTGSEVDQVARGLIAEAGYGEYFGHGLGHSVGLFIHEEPRLSPKCHSALQKNMTMTVEPGIYIPEFGGVRIEDLVVITEKGCRNLAHSPKELIEL